MFQLILLQAAGGGFMQLLFPVAIIIVFYFFMLRPQQQQAKKTQNFQSSLTPNMEVVLQSGIIGRITKIDENVVTLMVDEKTKIRVLRGFIAQEYTAKTGDEK